MNDTITTPNQKCSASVTLAASNVFSDPECVAENKYQVLICIPTKPHCCWKWAENKS